MKIIFQSDDGEKIYRQLITHDPVEGEKLTIDIMAPLQGEASICVTSNKQEIKNGNI